MITNVCFSQTIFFDYEIIFDAPNPQLKNISEDSLQYFVEDHFYFDRITHYYDEKIYMFSNYNPTGMVLKRVYDELVNTFG